MSDTRGGVHRGKDRVEVQAIDEPGDGGPRRPRHRPRREVVSQWAAGSAGGQARDVLVPRPGMQARDGMEAGGAMTTARITVKGGWIEVTHEGETLTLAAIGSPLNYLVRPPTSIPARHRQSEDRSRFRRLAAEAIREKDAAADPEEAEVVWSWRNG